MADDVEGSQPAGSQKRRGPYRLKNGATMKIMDVVPNAQGELLVKMTWDVPVRGITNKKVVIKYTDLSNNRAKDSVYNQLGCAVFLEDVNNHNTAFPKFIEDEIEAAEDARRVGMGMDVVIQKPMKDFKEISVEIINKKTYLIAGEGQVFILNEGTNYSRKLTSQEIDDLEIHILWSSKEPPEEFESNDEEAAKALVDLIGTFNELQDEAYYGFPLGSFVAHLRGYLYELLLREQIQFYSTVTVSGDQQGTGKSLMFSINQSLLYGRLIAAEKHISDAKMFHKLACLGDGAKVPVYVNEWDGSSGLFNNAVKGVWEGSSWSVCKGGASYVPRTVLLANANSTPDQLRFDAGVKSKVAFLFTGDIRLKHDRKLEITRGLVAKAKEAHVFLPSIIGFAVKTLREKVVDDDLRRYKDELEGDEDERGAQSLKDFDNAFLELQDAIGRFGITPPTFFQKDPDHSVLTYFNENNEVEVEGPEVGKKRAASNLVKELAKTQKLGEVLSKRTYREVDGYKVNSNAVPASVQIEMYRATDSFSTTDQGKRVRLRFLPMDRLEIEDQNLIDDFLTSFSFLFKRGMDFHSNLVSQRRESFSTMIEKSSRQYDRSNSPIASEEGGGINVEGGGINLDEEDEADDDPMGESADEPGLMCGVQGCPNKDTVWKSQDRLKKHRETKSHMKAEKSLRSQEKFKQKSK